MTEQEREALVGVNMHEPPMRVRHADLTPYSGSYKRECPKCGEGLLLVRRNIDTFKIKEMDYCVLCAQQFIYEDAAKIDEAAFEERREGMT